MEYEEFEALTPGQRWARAGNVGVRPGHPDYLLQQRVDLEAAIRINGFVRALCGADACIECREANGGLAILVSEVRS
jgi:hypothetical protein